MKGEQLTTKQEEIKWKLDQYNNVKATELLKLVQLVSHKVNGRKIPAFLQPLFFLLLIFIFGSPIRLPFYPQNAPLGLIGRRDRSAARWLVTDSLSLSDLTAFPRLELEKSVHSVDHHGQKSEKLPTNNKHYIENHIWMEASSTNLIQQLQNQSNLNRITMNT